MEPRYCPSLETKFRQASPSTWWRVATWPGLLLAFAGVVRDSHAHSAACVRRRFPGRTHHVWLEPEGLETDVIYPNGISNSLEPEDQPRLLQSIPGACLFSFSQRAWLPCARPAASVAAQPTQAGPGLAAPQGWSRRACWFQPMPWSTTMSTRGSCCPRWRHGAWAGCTWRGRSMVPRATRRRRRRAWWRGPTPLCQVGPLPQLPAGGVAVSGGGAPGLAPTLRAWLCQRASPSAHTP